jgi:hypothetical protein
MEIGAVGGYASGLAPAYASALGGGRRARQDELSPEEKQQVQELRQIDAKVRAHEQAHLAAAAGLAMGGANFQTTRGPDGKQYAVAGEVSIDVSPAQSPEQTIDKARRIQAAALAPADPSPQDRAVAAAAAQMAAQARAEAQRLKAEEAQADDGVAAAPGAAPDDRDATAQRRGAIQAYARAEPAPEANFSVFA